jgi:hypothetical protein
VDPGGGPLNVLALCTVVGAGAWPAPDDKPVTPADAVRAALTDARTLGPAAAYTRYLSAGHLPPGERGELYAVLSYHVNGLSREGPVARPRRVNPWLWAVDVRDYGWPYDRWGQFAWNPRSVEPYFHVEPLGADGKPARPLLGAPWLPAAELAELMKLTDSASPVVRGDWLLNRTAIQEGRDGFGYLDFLGLASRADAEKLAGLDRGKATALYREQAAVIADSGVALQGRQLFRFQTISGAWWESRDTKGEAAGRDKRNPVRLLLDDFRHDAEEIVFTLPNGLPGFYLSDAAGKQVASAPPDIASDRLTRNNDARVHVGMSCVRCHQAGGLKPFDDYARKLYGAGSGVALGSTDDVKFRRLKSVYLGPIGRAFDRDAGDYAAAIREACGLTPEGLSRAYAAQWSRYLDERVTAERASAEVGLTPGEFKDRLRRYAAGARLIDPVIAGFVANDNPGVRREQFEELFPLLTNALGVTP